MLQQQPEGRRRKKYRRRDILAYRTKLVHLKHFMRLKFRLRDKLAPVVVKSFAGNDRGLAFSSNIQSASWPRRDQLEFRAYSVNDSPVSFNDVPTSVSHTLWEAFSVVCWRFVACFGQLHWDNAQRNSDLRLAPAINVLTPIYMAFLYCYVRA